VTRERFCYDCGARCSVVDRIPVCRRCGPRWKLARNAPCAEVLVERDAAVLLVRRANEPHRGRWELPGGFVEHGEHPADAARREIVEELGVPVRLTGVLGVYLDQYLDEISQVLTFVGTIDGAPVPDPSEVSEVRWFSTDEFPEPSELFPGHDARLRDWLRIRDGEPPRSLLA
jgi:8-oxo-dGTP diphosphatase